MHETYARQRDWLLARWPAIADALPAEPPSPPPVRRMSRAEVRRILAEPANNHASLCVVVGWGDGSIVETMLEDPLLAQKQQVVVLLDGDEPYFASSLRRPMLDGLIRSRVDVVRLRDDGDITGIIESLFTRHADIPRLAGCDLVADHPLGERACATRTRHLPRLVTRLSDRPTAFGNDIGDSFIGLGHAAVNAATLLPAPDNDTLSGWYGSVPAISIAAGPTLKSHIPRLRELQDRCLLVACDAVLHGLIDEGIHPHFVTPLERVPKTASMTARAGESTAWFAGMPVVHPDTLAPFGERAIFVSAGDELYDWLFPQRKTPLFAGSSSGVLSYTVAAMLTTGPVWLVGHDLSREDGASHWNGAGFASAGWKEARAAADRQQQWQGGYEPRRIARNGGGVVDTIAWWDRFREDIVLEVRRLRGAARATYNVNAHYGVGAVIEGTEAAPLPDAASLPKLAPRPLPARDPARLEQWRARARELPADARAYRDHLARLRDDIAAARDLPPDRWPIEELAKRATLTDGVSEGNRRAFAYFLRSALHNVTAEMHRRRRTPSSARSRWESLGSLDHFVHAVDNAVGALEPALHMIADGRHVC